MIFVDILCLAQKKENEEFLAPKTTKKQVLCESRVFWRKKQSKRVCFGANPTENGANTDHRSKIAKYSSEIAEYSWIWDSRTVEYSWIWGQKTRRVQLDYSWIHFGYSWITAGFGD